MALGGGVFGECKDLGDGEGGSRRVGRAVAREGGAEAVDADEARIRASDVLVGNLDARLGDDHCCGDMEVGNPRCTGVDAVRRGVQLYQVVTRLVVRLMPIIIYLSLNNLRHAT